jgi:hypothetical protein
MISSQAKTTSKQDIVKAWWEHVKVQLKPFFEVMADGGRIHKNELEAALNYLQTRSIELAQAQYHEAVEAMREQLLSAVENLIHSLHYRLEGNSYQSQIRLDMAKMNVDTLRFHLLQHNIMA